MSNEKWSKRWQGSVAPSYGAPQLTLTRGEGLYVWDADGNRYMDLLAGIAVNILGHAHPAIRDAVDLQLATLGHVSNIYANTPNVELAERLLELFGQHGSSGRVFFCNSGTEANEAAFKLSRLTGRSHIVGTHDAFHGRTMGSLALTGQPAKQMPFVPLPGEVTHVPFGDVDAMQRAVTADTAAVIVEPILGEAGVVVPPSGYLQEVRRITAAHGALMIVDEVQTGIARTGAWFGFQWEQIEPDVVTLAKGLGGGLPIGACVMFGQAATLFQPGMHGSTFGGNPVSSAAALAVLNTVHAEDLVARAGVAGRRLMLGVDALQHPAIAGVRGRGLLIGIGLREANAKAVAAACQRAGYLVNAAAPDIIRLAPPLVIGDDHIDSFVRSLPAILEDVS